MHFLTIYQLLAPFIFLTFSSAAETQGYVVNMAGYETYLDTIYINNAVPDRYKATHDLSVRFLDSNSTVKLSTRQDSNLFDAVISNNKCWLIFSTSKMQNRSIA